MTTLHLGVTDLPYSNAPGAARGKSGTQTTGDVAEWLENKYHLMERFYEHYELDIAKSLEGSMAGALESLLMGSSNSQDPFGTATADIEHMFRQAISTREVETWNIPGVPTEAARRGVNHRLAHPYAKSNPRRPSFRDTGLYEKNFKAWVD